MGCNYCGNFGHIVGDYCLTASLSMDACVSVTTHDDRPNNLFEHDYVLMLIGNEHYIILLYIDYVDFLRMIEDYDRICVRIERLNTTWET